MGSLIRRIISIVLIAGLIVAIIYGFLWLRLNNYSRMDTHEAVPPEFVFCLETSNYNRLTSALQNHSNIWKEFQKYWTVKELNRLMHEIDSLSRNSEDIKGLVEGNVLISAYQAEDKLDFLFVLNSPDRNATDELLKLIDPETEIDKEKFENSTLYTLDFMQKFPDLLSFTETRGLFIIASSKELIKKSVLHINHNENVFESPEFQKIRTTLGSDVEAHLYISFDELEQMAGWIVNENKLPDLSGFTSSAALDVEIKPDQLLFNGFSSLNDSTFQQLSLFEGQDPVEQALFTVIPSTVVYFKWLGVSDSQKFMMNLERSDSQPSEGQDFREIFYSFFRGQAAEIILRKGMSIFSKFAIISVKSQGQAENILRDFFQENYPDQIKSEEIVIAENYSLEAYKLAFKGIENAMFADLFPESNYEWYCFYDNHLVFAKTIADLKEFVYLNTLGKTLDNDDYFQGLKDNFSSRSNLFIYFDPSQYYPEILENLKPETRSVIEEHSDSWKKLNVVGFQNTVADELNYFRLFINYTGKIREFVNTVWERKLEANLSIKPTVVLNHNNDEKEIFVQDEKNIIYLINNSGGIIWKQSIDGPILGNVHQMDYYGNGKLQYLFNTESKIHLIDRNGNNVESFPVNLREKASAGLSLFDYDSKLDYRIPVPTVDRDILMYDKHGDIVTGWKFRRADQEINFPVEHYRIGDKDYIVARDEFNLYILNRRGRKRVKPSEQIDFSMNNPVYLNSGFSGTERLIASDKTGDVYAFFFDGKVEKIMEQKMSEDHFFVPADLNGDRRLEYIFMDSTRLEVYDGSSDLIFSELYPEKINLPPVIYSFSSADKKIGIVAGESERIYLVNNDGSLYQGFPLQGSSLFSISSFPGLKDRFNLLVGNNDNFLYNYSVK